MENSMTIETPEQAGAAQRQIEEFACLARDVSAAVTKLKNAFDALTDFPESVDEAIVPLGNAATTLAQDTRDWAAECNADFNPSSVDDAQYVVIGDDGCAYGPYLSRATAIGVAEACDGSIFEISEANRRG
jgi:hypothetical protein